MRISYGFSENAEFQNKMNRKSIMIGEMSRWAIQLVAGMLDKNANFKCWVTYGPSGIDLLHQLTKPCKVDSTLQIAKAIFPKMVLKIHLLLMRRTQLIDFGCIAFHFSQCPYRYCPSHNHDCEMLVKKTRSRNHMQKNTFMVVYCFDVVSHQVVLLFHDKLLHSILCTHISLPPSP